MPTLLQQKILSWLSVPLECDVRETPKRLGALGAVPVQQLGRTEGAMKTCITMVAGYNRLGRISGFSP